MNEISAFDLLVEYLKNKGIQAETHKNIQHFHYVPSDSFLNTKYVLFKKNALIFYAYDSYAAKAQSNRTFTGIYSVINLPSDFECRISLKNWIDFVFIRKRIKPSDALVYENFTVSSNSETIINTLFTEAEAKRYLQINKKITPLTLLIKNDYMPNIKECAGKKIIALEANDWIYKPDELDLFLSLGEQLLQNMLKNAKKF